MMDEPVPVVMARAMTKVISSSRELIQTLAKEHIRKSLLDLESSLIKDSPLARSLSAKDASRVGLGILVSIKSKEADSRDGAFVGSDAKGMSQESAPTKTIPVNLKLETFQFAY